MPVYVFCSQFPFSGTVDAIWLLSYQHYWNSWHALWFPLSWCQTPVGLFYQIAGLPIVTWSACTNLPSRARWHLYQIGSPFCRSKCISQPLKAARAALYIKKICWQERQTITHASAIFPLWEQTPIHITWCNLVAYSVTAHWVEFGQDAVLLSVK